MLWVMPKLVFDKLSRESQIYFDAIAFIFNYVGLPQVCYGRYGCFDHYPPFANLLVNLPQSPEIVGAKFYLFTRENKDASSAQELDDSDLNKLTSSNFNISRRTIIVCHGWTGRKLRRNLRPVNEPEKKHVSMESITSYSQRLCIDMARYKDEIRTK